MKEKEKKTMSVSEVAKMMGVTNPSVYNWVKHGLKGTTERVIGRKARLVFTMEDLTEFFQVTEEELLNRRWEKDE